MVQECPENSREGLSGRSGYILDNTVVEESRRPVPVIASSQQRDGNTKGALVDGLVQG